MEFMEFLTGTRREKILFVLSCVYHAMSRNIPLKSNVLVRAINVMYLEKKILENLRAGDSKARFAEINSVSLRNDTSVCRAQMFQRFVSAPTHA